MQLATCIFVTSLRVWLWLLSEASRDGCLPPQVFSWVSEMGCTSQIAICHPENDDYPMDLGVPMGPLFLDKATGVHTDQGHSVWNECGVLTQVWHQKHTMEMCPWIPGDVPGRCRSFCLGDGYVFPWGASWSYNQRFPTWSNCAWKFHAHNFHNVSSSSHLTKMFQGLESLDGLPGWPERVELSPHPSLWRSWSGPLCSPCWALSSFLWHCDLEYWDPNWILPRGFWRGF